MRLLLPGNRQGGTREFLLFMFSTNGTKIHASAKAKELRLLESAQTFLTERRVAIPPRA
jgi:hypothetical protein